MPLYLSHKVPGKSQIIESYFLCVFWPELEDIHVSVHVNLLKRMV